MKKQILPAPVHYVVWRSDPGGAESYISHYVRHFAGRRERHICSLRSADNGLSTDPEVYFHPGGGNSLQCYTRYFGYCRRHRQDLFHLMSVGPVILLLTLLAGVRNPVYHIHGTIYWKKTLDRIYLKTAWWLSSFFRVRFIANSKYSAAIFHKKVLPVWPKVIYNGFEMDRFLEKRTLRPDLRRMAYAGRLHTGKNVDLVIRLFEEIAGEMPELELHIAGDGMLRPALEEQARQSPFGKRIIFHGWVQDVPSFYRSVDLFVFLSAYESFGNVLLEALLTGLPILTSDVPVFEEIHGGESAFCLGNPEFYPGLAAAFRQAISHYPALAEKAFATGERLRKTFSLEKHLTEIEHIYEKTESTGHLLPLRSAEAV